MADQSLAESSADARPTDGASNPDGSAPDGAGPEPSLDAALDSADSAADTMQPGMDSTVAPDAPADSVVAPDNVVAPDVLVADVPIVDVPIVDVPVLDVPDAAVSLEAGPEAGGCSGATPDTCGTSCVDLQTDLLHCGNCAMVCTSAPPNAHPTCAGGTCGSACTTGWGDCDSTIAGCETPTVGDSNNCGACGHVCPAAANGSALCVVGFCQVHCNSGYADCDRNPSNGCEVSLADGGACH